MSRPYGKLPPGGQKGQRAPGADEIQVNITDRHTMEQIALEVQRALAMVQDRGAVGVEAFRFRLLPLDANGAEMVLFDDRGQQIKHINIPEKPSQPVYRENEPGVGVTTATQIPKPKTGNDPSR